jgi:hypothetical protein
MPRFRETKHHERAIIQALITNSGTRKMTENEEEEEEEEEDISISKRSNRSPGYRVLRNRPPAPWSANANIGWEGGHKNQLEQQHDRSMSLPGCMVAGSMVSDGV